MDALGPATLSVSLTPAGTCPHRREAYTCWSTASGARINNYGTRIDLILTAGPCGDASRGFHAAVTGSDIWMDAHGSDHAPVYADLASGLPVACPEVPPQLSSRYLYTGTPSTFALISCSLSSSRGFSLPPADRVAVAGTLSISPSHGCIKQSSTRAPHKIIARGCQSGSDMHIRLQASRGI